MSVGMHPPSGPSSAATNPHQKDDAPGTRTTPPWDAETAAQSGLVWRPSRPELILGGEYPGSEAGEPVQGAGRLALAGDHGRQREEGAVKQRERIQQKHGRRH